MFANNGNISNRQLYRLIFLNYLGVTSLLVPSILAIYTGVEGLFCIFCAAGLIYFLMHFKVWQFLLSIYYLGLFFCAAHLLSDLMHRNLREVPYVILYLCTIFTAVYIYKIGREKRARVFEILFWPIVGLLSIMLLFAVGTVEPVYYLPQNGLRLHNLVTGTVVMLLFYIPFLYFAPLKKQYQTKPIKMAYWSGTCYLALIYLILLGCFGRGSLMNMNYPIVTLMSTIQSKGLFLQRMDAFMLFVWFFCLFAILSTSLSVAVKGIRGKKIFFHLLLLLLLTGCTSRELEQRYFPVLMAVERLDNGNFAFHYEVMKEDLTQFGEGETFEESRAQYEMTIDKSVDVNHLKVVVLSQELMLDDAMRCDLIETIAREQQYPLNTLVCTTSDFEGLMNVSMGEELGSYLQDYLKLHAGKQTTLKDLINAYENQRGEIEIPNVEGREKMILYTGMQTYMNINQK